MIRKLNEKDREAVLDYLTVRASYSVFLMADIFKYGFDGEVFSVWGGFDGEGRLKYVFGKYYDVLMLYTVSETIDAGAIYRYLKQNGLDDYKVFVGRSSLYTEYQKYESFSQAELTYLCELKKEDFRPVHNDIETRFATAEDAQDIHDLRSTIEEFAGLEMGIESLRASLAEGKTFIAEKDGELICCAVCGAVAGGLANIGGVCTRKGMRGLGYASKTVSDLCAMLLSQGLTCSLSFNNPAAGSIYKRMGFKEAGHIYIAVK